MFAPISLNGKPFAKVLNNLNFETFVFIVETVYRVIIESQAFFDLNLN